MKHNVFVLVVLFSMFSQAQEEHALAELKNLVWKNRIIIINEPADADTARAILADQVTEIDDRDIIWFVIQGELAFTNYLGTLSSDFVSNTRTKLKPISEKIILIGKDGGVKSQHNDLDVSTTIGAIFSEIDAMPMRQREMQE